jgi:hypothetical protein
MAMICSGNNENRAKLLPHTTSADAFVFFQDNIKLAFVLPIADQISLSFFFLEGMSHISSKYYLAN